jgi:hypothetical protein
LAFSEYRNDIAVKQSIKIVKRIFYYNSRPFSRPPMLALRTATGGDLFAMLIYNTGQNTLLKGPMFMRKTPESPALL